MPLDHHPLVKELPELREEIHRLKLEDPEFRELFDAYHELDRRVYRIEQDIELVEDALAAQLKRRRVLLKDQLHARLLDARHGQPASPAAVRIDCRGLELDGELQVPARARGLVVFAHGADSSRFSPRNRGVARALRGARFATLLFDLRKEAEAEAELLAGGAVLDVERDAERVAAAADWARREEATQGLPLGLFGAGTGGAAALLAAVRRAGVVRAVVCRGARLDLAAEALVQVRAPTLLVVGGRDEATLALHRERLARVRSGLRLELVPQAGPLFEEPGALDALARLSASWFAEHLASGDG